MGKLAGTAWLFLAALAGCSATPASRSDTGDSRGALLAASCTGCHGAASARPGGLPQLRGLSAKTIQDSLLGFRDGTLPGTLMPRLARGYSDLEIDLISGYLGTP